jgi:xylulokinase
LERMRELGIVPTEIRLTGGASKSAVWRQICANIFDCPVVTLVQSEGAALGAAIQALAAAQTKKSVADWSSHIVQTNPGRIEPDKKLASDYVDARKKFISLTQTLADKRFL